MLNNCYGLSNYNHQYVCVCIHYTHTHTQGREGEGGKGRGREQEKERDMTLRYLRMKVNYSNYLLVFYGTQAYKLYPSAVLIFYLFNSSQIFTNAMFKTATVQFKIFN